MYQNDLHAKGCGSCGGDCGGGCTGETGGRCPQQPAMGYVPDQSFSKLYTPSTALCRGTLFGALDKPFSGKGCHCEE